MPQITHITGTTPDGRPAAVTISLDAATAVTVLAPPAPPAPVIPNEPRPALVVGATTVPAEFGELQIGGTLDGAEVCRTYSRHSEGMLGWDHPHRKLPQHVAEHHSFADWPSDAVVADRLTRWLDTMPTDLLEGEALLPQLRPHDPDGYAPASTVYDGFSVLLSYWHDGEREFLSQGFGVKEWRRRHAFLYRLIRQHPNGFRVGYMSVQTGPWTEAHSVPGNPKGDFDPLSFWAGVGDYAGYCAYAVSVAARQITPALYRAAADFLSVPLRLARGSGRPLWLADLGVALQTGPPETLAHARADWIRAVVAELRDVGAAGVTWIDGYGPSGWDFRLTDPPSLTAWQDAMYGRN